MFNKQTPINLFYFLKHNLIKSYFVDHVQGSEDSPVPFAQAQNEVLSEGDNLNSNIAQNNPFYSVIPTQYIQSKDLPIVLYFHLFVLNSPVEFKEAIISRISCGFIYTVFIKIRYNKDNFFMAGNQFGFDFKSFNDIDDLLSIVNGRLEEKFEDYNLTDEFIVYIQLSFKKLDTKLLSEFGVDNLNNVPLLAYSGVKQKLNIPVSVNEDSLGKSLDVVIVNNKIVNICLIINNNKVNFLEKIKEKASMLKRVNHTDNITSFDSNFKFYLIRGENNNYILALNHINDKSIEEIRYSLNGVVINHIFDRLVNDTIIRK